MFIPTVPDGVIGYSVMLNVHRSKDTPYDWSGTGGGRVPMLIKVLVPRSGDSSVVRAPDS